MLIFTLHFNCFFDRSELAFNPKDVKLSRKSASPSTDGKLTESEIRDKIKRLSQTLANKVSISLTCWVVDDSSSLVHNRRKKEKREVTFTFINIYF